MQEFIGILGVFLAVNVLPSMVAISLCMDESWSNFWRFFGYGWVAQICASLLIVVLFVIFLMIIWGFNVGS